MTEQPKPEPRANAPYEGALNIAFNRLTSEILIFLLAYMILLIGLAAFGSSIETELRSLFYIIPVLGVGAYIWLKRRTIVKKAGDQSVQVRSHRAEDEAYVGGVRCPVQALPNKVDVDSYKASGRAQVVGVDVGNTHVTSTETAQSTDAQNIMLIFQQLNQENRKRLFVNAMDMLTKQEQPNA